MRVCLLAGRRVKPGTVDWQGSSACTPPSCWPSSWTLPNLWPGRCLQLWNSPRPNRFTLEYTGRHYFPGAHTESGSKGRAVGGGVPEKYVCSVVACPLHTHVTHTFFPPSPLSHCGFLQHRAYFDLFTFHLRKGRLLLTTDIFTLCSQPFTHHFASFWFLLKGSGGGGVSRKDHRDMERKLTKKA